MALFNPKESSTIDGFWGSLHLGRWVKGYFWLVVITFSHLVVEFLLPILTPVVGFIWQTGAFFIFQSALGSTCAGGDISLGAGKHSFKLNISFAALSFEVIVLCSLYRNDFIHMSEQTG